jgi:hypothetical protein
MLRAYFTGPAPTNSRKLPSTLNNACANGGKLRKKSSDYSAVIRCGARYAHFHAIGFFDDQITGMDIE